jgi:hypothetical protein
MIQRDYVLRLIEQFFQVVRRMVNYRTEKRYAEALNEARKAYKGCLGVDAAFIDSQSAEGLIEMGRSGLFGPEQLAMAAKLLREEAEALEGLEVPIEANIRRIKSLALFLEVFLADKTPRLQVFHEDLDILLGQLEQTGLPLDLARRAPLWLEKKERFSEAEDAWFRLAEAVGAGDRAMLEGEEFYRRLSELDDAALERAGLPRDEVADGLESWRELWAAK